MANQDGVCFGDQTELRCSEVLLIAHSRRLRHDSRQRGAPGEPHLRLGLRFRQRLIIK